MAAMQMDPELARRLFFEGATVVILNMPKGTEFGIDYNSWEVGPKFRGVKMIPPGIHFLHYSSVDKANPREVGPRMGFFLNLQQRGLKVLRWDAAREEVDLSPAPEAEVEAMRANLQELDQFLGPYPYATLKKWISLTNFISEATVEKLQPESRQICAFSEVLPVLSMRHTKDRVGQNLPRCGAECKSYQEGLARLPEMKPRAGTEIRFSELPTQMFPAGATPAEITRHSMDLSYALETVLSKQFPCSPQDVLGELQFAFVCFLLGNVYEAFEHWKRLLNLLCRSEEAMVKHHSLYVNLISILYHQLGEIPADFFVDIVSQDNFLTSTLQDTAKNQEGEGKARSCHSLRRCACTQSALKAGRPGHLSESIRGEGDGELAGQQACVTVDTGPRSQANWAQGPLGTGLGHSTRCSGCSSEAQHVSCFP
ncbi:protein AAR2 homolog isoform X1 [Bubalus bubalis]|uniref:protein AAR2 homolog isoform X1 n=1 Tax=Bubalus bubalis TaxID=89462 RepID=UPI000DBC7F5E|nr:protein AAR2 homolog isoform X1 [Bubalus bubalis]XP_006072523.4 protein AAR2 homolog isoform X1 [Bubalus bubalis]